MTIRLNPFSWNKKANILYVDQPVGTGMSFLRNITGLVTNERQLDAEFYNFLTQFFEIFPEYQNRRLFLTGESFAGIYIPFIAKYIVERNNLNKSLRGTRDGDGRNVGNINLEGIALGNGWIDPANQYWSYITYAYNLGLIDSAQRKELEVLYPICLEEIRNHTDIRSGNACDKLWLGPLEMSSGPNQCVNVYDVRLYDCGNSEWPSGSSRIVTYLNRNDVREVLHATQEAFFRYDECSETVGAALLNDTNLSVVDVLVYLLDEAHLRVLLYNGQFDYICNHVGAEMALNALRWKHQMDYQQSRRYSWLVGGKVSGYAHQAANLTFVQVVGASHMVPYDVPEASLDLLNRFLENKPFKDYLPPQTPQTHTDKTASSSKRFFPRWKQILKTNDHYTTNTH
jgi:carboxypeptidase D